MITLEQACEIYEKRTRWPIDCIVENENEWAFFKATNGFNGIYIPVVNKKTGECEDKAFQDYDELPEVPIPPRFRKKAPEKIYPSGIEAILGPLYDENGKPLEY